MYRDVCPTEPRERERERKGWTRDARGTPAGYTIATHFPTFATTIIIKGFIAIRVRAWNSRRRLTIPLQSRPLLFRRIVLSCTITSTYAVDRVRRPSSIYAYVSFDYLHIALGIEALIVLSHSWPAMLSRANDKPSEDAWANNGTLIRRDNPRKESNRRGARDESGRRETERRDPARKYGGISRGMNSELCVRQMRGHEN